MKQWILMLSLASLSTPVLAEDSVSFVPNYDPAKKAEKMVNQMDRNHDGSISVKEYLRPANIRFERFDTDGNGELAKTELYEFWKNKRKTHTNPNAWEGPTDAHFKRYDANKDDVITRSEYFHQSEVRFAGLDTNQNKLLSLEELTAHWEARKKEAEAYDFSEKDDD